MLFILKVLLKSCLSCIRNLWLKVEGGLNGKFWGANSKEKVLIFLRKDLGGWEREKIFWILA